jgi:hypothetical protein
MEQSLEMNAIAPGKEINAAPLWLFPIVGVCVYVVMLWLLPSESKERMLLGRNDFVAFYAGAKLVGNADPYDGAAVERIQREVAGMQSGHLHYIRLPFYGYFLRPLGWLPYRGAYLLFQAVNLLCFFWFLWQFVPGNRELAAFASLSIPLYAMLQNGQDTGLLLFLVSCSVVLTRKRLDLWSGFVLSLCAIKPHLFLLMPLVLILQRRWRVLSGAVIGGILLLAISFGVGGQGWPRAFLKVATGPLENPALDNMPNLRTLSVLLGPADLAVQILLSACVILATAYLAFHTADYEMAFTFGIIGSLLISFHSYTQDCLILLLPLAVILSRPSPKSVRWLMELVASPIAYFFMLAGVPFNIVMPSLLASILAVSVRDIRRPRMVRAADAAC